MLDTRWALEPGPCSGPRVGCETQNREPKVAALSLGASIYNASKPTAG